MIDKTGYLLRIFYLHCILSIIYLEMENMCTMNFWFIPGARGINRKSEKTNSASTGKFRSTGHISIPIVPADHIRCLLRRYFRDIFFGFSLHIPLVLSVSSATASRTEPTFMPASWESIQRFLIVVYRPWCFLLRLWCCCHRNLSSWVPHLEVNR